MARELLTLDTFTYSRENIGALVAQEVVEEMVNALPPACMRSTSTQMGEAYSHKFDPQQERWRPTFATFKRMYEEGEGVWQFCGFCFLGENQERGREMQVVGGAV